MNNQMRTRFCNDVIRFVLPRIVLYLMVFVSPTVLVGSSVLNGQEPKTILPRAHAHNDYYHTRPLLDALDQGFCSVEADVFWRKGDLFVAHTFLEIRENRTLKKLYLDPLFSRVKNNNGSVFRKSNSFVLLIDFKTKPLETLATLEKQLRPFRQYLTRLKDGNLISGGVTIVVSGNRPTKEIVEAKNRLVFLDGRLSDPSTWSEKISPIVSESWNTHFRYRGFGDMKKEEQEKLNQIVAKVHKQNKRIRFWALPDRENGWRTAYDSGVDLINTDKLAELRKFLLQNR